MSKTNYFNLNDFKAGKTATTKLGNPVKFITMLNDGRILVKVYHRTRVIGSFSKTIVPELDGTVERYQSDGKKYRGTTTEFDLIMDVPSRPRNAKGQFIKMS